MELIDKYEPSETGESPALGKGSTETPPAPPAPPFGVYFTSRGRLASLRVPGLALGHTACLPRAAASGTPIAPGAPACCRMPPAAPFAPAPFPCVLPSPLLPSACSQGSPRAECRRVPHVPLLPGGLHLQPPAPGAVAGHDPAALPLLHLLLAQHLPDRGPDPGPEQHRGLHQVTGLLPPTHPRDPRQLHGGKPSKRRSSFWLRAAPGRGAAGILP